MFYFGKFWKSMLKFKGPIDIFSGLQLYTDERLDVRRIVPMLVTSRNKVKKNPSKYLT